MFINIDIFEWSDEWRERGEAAVRAYESASEHTNLDVIDWPVVVSGNVVDDATGRFDNCAVTYHASFAEWDDIPELFGASISDDPEDMGPTPIYHYNTWMGLRIIDLDDPYLVEHGPEGWSRRLAEPYLAACRKYPNYARVMRNLAFKHGWGRGGSVPRIAENVAREGAGLPFLEIDE